MKYLPSLILLFAVSTPGHADPQVEQLQKVVARQEAEINRLRQHLPAQVDPVLADGYCGISESFSADGFKMTCGKSLSKTIAPGSWLVTLTQRVATTCDGSLSTVTVAPSLENGTIVGSPICEPGAPDGRTFSTCNYTFVMKNTVPVNQYKVSAYNSTSKSRTVSPCSVGLYEFKLVAQPWYN